MTVTAREVLGIVAHGYKIIRPNPKLEAVALCSDERQAMAASLITYKDFVQRYQTRNAMLEFANSLPSDARY